MMCLDIGRGSTLPSYYFSTWVACKSHCSAIPTPPHPHPPFFLGKLRRFLFRLQSRTDSKLCQLYLTNTARINAWYHGYHCVRVRIIKNDSTCNICIRDVEFFVFFLHEWNLKLFPESFTSLSQPRDHSQWILLLLCYLLLDHIYSHWHKEYTVYTKERTM